MISTSSIWRRMNRNTTDVIASGTPPADSATIATIAPAMIGPMNVMTSSSRHEHAQRERVRQVEDRTEHDRHDRPHERHQHQLAAQPAAHHDVDPARDPPDLGPVRRAQEAEGDLAELAAVEQQEERHDEHEHGVQRPVEERLGRLIAPSGVWRNVRAAPPRAARRAPRP